MKPEQMQQGQMQQEQMQQGQVRQQGERVAWAWVSGVVGEAVP